MGRTGTQIANELQAAGAADLDRRVLSLIKSGALAGPWRDVRAIEWVDVPSRAGALSAVFRVARLPVCLGTDDDLLFAPVSADTQQQIADLFGLVQPTTKLLDLCRTTAAIQVNAPTQLSDRAERIQAGLSPDMKDALASLKFTRDVLKLWPKEGIAGFPFKTWALTNRAETVGQAYNYGFYSSAPPYRSVSGLRLWQQLSGKHNTRHWDYSQVGVFFAMECTVSGPGFGENRRMRLADVLLDPQLCILASSEGVLKTLRQPLLEQSSIIAPRPSTPRTAPLIYRRTLRLGSRDLAADPSVSELQAFLGARPDGSFGPVTAGLVRELQRSVGLPDDGVAGPQTYAAINDLIAQRAASNVSLSKPAPAPAPPAPVTVAPAPAVPPLEPPTGLRLPSPLVAGFRRAKHFLASTRTVNKLVLHVAEIAELITSAEGLAAYVATMADGRLASWHYSVDVDSIWQSVEDQYVAYHAPGANHDGIGIEIAGYSRQTPTEWADDYSAATLELTAQLCAALCRKHQLPVVFLDAKALLASADARGITTHAEVTKAFKRSTHTDPGKSFPTAAFLARVAQLAA